MSAQSPVTVVTDDPTDKKMGVSTPARQVPGLALFTGLLILAQHVWTEHDVTKRWPLGAALTLAAGAAAGLFWLFRVRKGFFERLGSVTFSVAILLSLAVATALGTMTPQGPLPSTPETVTVGHDGHEALASAARPVGFGAHMTGLLFLNDIFHSFWYGGLLYLLALALLLTVVRRPFWKPYFWGFFLAHIGLVFVLLGGTLGRCWGEAGLMSLRVGEPVDTFDVLKRGVTGGREKKLGFALRLDDFEVEKYPPKNPAQLLVLRMERHMENPLPVFTSPAHEAGTSFEIPDTDLRVVIRAFYPDVEVTETMEETSDADMPPAAEILLKDGALEARYWLIGGFSPQMSLHASGLDVEWGDLGEEDWAARTLHGQPAKHWISVPGDTPPLDVRVGGTYTLPDGKQQFTVVAFYPDFRIDMETRQASSVSNEPRNPALQVEVPDAQGKRVTHYLFPGMGSHMGKDNAMDLSYRYDAGREQIPHLIRVDGLNRQFAYAAQGREVLRRPFEPGRPEDVPLAEVQNGSRTVQFTVLKLLAHAKSKRNARTLSQEIRNPAVLVGIQRIDHEEITSEALLVAKADGESGEDSWIEIGPDLILALNTRKAEVKAWRSRVSVIRDNEVVDSATIEVNAPFSYEGYTFYQSNADERRPDYSGLRVARDPGLILAFAGMVMASLGVTYTLYVRPRLRREGLAAKEAA